MSISNGEVGSSVRAKLNEAIGKIDISYSWGDHADAGYLTAEADTLASVTARGATTDEDLTLNGAITGTAITQSAIDTTAGRLLKVGDFGAGTIITVAPTSMDDLTAPGVYLLNPNPADAPANAGQFVRANVRVYGDPSLGIIQLYQPTRASTATTEGVQTLWSRTLQVGSAWTAWIKMFTQGNILGTVSQSAGIPTGAIIERGSNANGEYVKFADGTMICHFSGVENNAINTAAGNLFRSAALTWTFPASFVAPAGSIYPSVYLSINGGAAAFEQAWGTPKTAPSNTAQEYYLLTPISTGAASYRTHFIAIGRWF